MKKKEPPSYKKKKITIRLDHDIISWFKNKVNNKAGRGGSYQGLINNVLREHIGHKSMEKSLRKLIREELKSIK